MDRPLPPPGRDTEAEPTPSMEAECTPSSKEKEKEKERPLLAPTGLGRITPRSACEPCRSRKIKCSGERPTCARCQKQGKDCVYANATTSWSYIAALEERIKFLEAEKGPAGSSPVPGPSRRGQAYRLPPVSTAERAYGNDIGNGNGNANAVAGSSNSNANYSSHSPPVHHSATKRPRTDRDSAYSDRDHKDASPSSSSPTGHKSRSHSGGSENFNMPSGRPPDHVPAQRHQAVSRPSASRFYPGFPREEATAHEGRRPGVSHPASRGPGQTRQPLAVPAAIIDLAHLDKTILPSYQHIHDLLQHFVLNTNSAYPLFHLPTLQNQLESVCFTDEPLPPSDIASVLLVLAIGASSLPRSSSLYHQLNPRAEMFVHAAMPYMANEEAVSGLTKLQIMLTHLIYAMYNNAANVWDLSGAAMRLAAELGLHHEHGSSATVDVTHHLEKDMGRRLFWIAYSIDRMSSTALLRPPSIPDAWINAGFPSIYDDSLISETEIVPGEPSPFKTTPIHIFQIRILQSEILSRLLTSSTASACPQVTTVPITSRPPPDEWYDEMIRRLEIWRELLPEGKGLTSIEWRRLQYHSTITLLFRPSPANRNPSREAVKRTMMSAIQTIKIYKDMYRMGRVDFPWVTMHAFFLQGVTYIDTLWRARHNNWDIAPPYIDALLDVQVCSSMLEALAAATPGTSGLRNTFETISERVIRHLTTCQWPGYQPGGGDISSVFSGASSSNSAYPRGFSNLKPTEALQADDKLAGSKQDVQVTGRSKAQDIGPAQEGEEEGPLDLFLFRPMGNMMGVEWEEMVDRALSML
ncbi:hypothetical protein IAR55_001227 [Kwoniella newhampshirensis]|uniref:Zn(2)-C6 fungal-type domain-containing protein n=1 Tax=Kwoniella newhampshirensis TaxID=1651941 RepID=A0AAW0Z5T4_9TREE